MWCPVVGGCLNARVWLVGRRIAAARILKPGPIGPLFELAGLDSVTPYGGCRGCWNAAIGYTSRCRPCFAGDWEQRKVVRNGASFGLSDGRRVRLPKGVWPPWPQKLKQGRVGTTWTSSQSIRLCAGRAAFLPLVKPDSAKRDPPPPFSLVLSTPAAQRRLRSQIVFPET